MDAPASSTKQYLVTVRTRFDEKTISEDRGNGPLTPNPRVVRLVDSVGREYAPSNNQEVALKSALRPGDTYNVKFAFQVPADAKGLKLFITSSGWPERLLIWDEDSPLHGRIYFALST